MTSPSEAHFQAAKYLADEARSYRAQSIVNRNILRIPDSGLDKRFLDRMDAAFDQRSFEKIIKDLRDLRHDISKEVEEMYANVSASGKQFSERTWKQIYKNILKRRLWVAELWRLINNLNLASEHRRAASINRKLAKQLKETGH